MQTVSSSEYLNLDNVVASYRRRAVLVIQSAFLLGACIVFAHSVGQTSMYVLFAIGLTITLSTLSLFWAYHGHNALAVILLATQFLLIPTYLAYVSLGTFDSAMFILPAGLLAIAVVVTPLVMAIFSVLILAATGFIAFATVQGTVGNSYFLAEVIKNPVDVIVTLVIVFFSGIIATYVSWILSTVLHKLAEYQSTLEQRVERRTRDLAKSNEELHLAMQRLDQARVELVRGEKLAGLGSLVAGVAHELNTPIGNTAMVASTMQDQVASFSKIFNSGKLRKSDLKLMIERVNEGTELLTRSTHRARELVASFKQVAVDQTSDRRREFNMEDVVEDVLSTLRPSFSAINVNSDVQPGILCDGYPGPLGQLLTNLIQNAIIHGIGQDKDGLVSVKCKSLDNDNIEIVVEDNGQGMSPETMNKIFDPFFTTRLGLGGSGLGLTIVHNLATGVLGGEIAVESTIGKGTQFVVTLPRIAPDSKN